MSKRNPVNDTGEYTSSHPGMPPQSLALRMQSKQFWKGRNSDCTFKPPVLRSRGSRKSGLNRQS
ncbi:hypothetical protein [Methanohalobium evestigatum]|uniref:hypothetical protein n=1 Tax=Methanohalobium evestigatum TaxID=2322 RepID=UPI0012F681DC|nr:hypothetical protein [Methanohalobium evestigatum]